MKFLKNLSLIAAAMCFLFVTSCGSKSSSTEEAPAMEEEAPAMEEESMEADTTMMEEDTMEADSTMMEEADSVAAEN